MNTRPTDGCRPGATRHPDSTSDFTATLRHQLSLHPWWDGLVTWRFLGTPLAEYAQQPLGLFRSSIEYVATMLKEAR
jgi:hypothetical protein